MLRGKKMHHIPQPLLLARRRGARVFSCPLSFARRRARRCPEPVEGGEVFKSFHVTSFHKNHFYLEI